MKYTWESEFNHGDKVWMAELVTGKVSGPYEIFGIVFYGFDYPFYQLVGTAVTPNEDQVFDSEKKARKKGREIKRDWKKRIVA